ncbi:sigma-70 family RNA polymerase sigma factor [Fretibacter rubidus]|uniref:sigma-70 family RNA polymerase sigma factor n=1 Tax=Fretibacter rubidus TaxID=570162 RepID=UPI00352BA7F8
MPDLVTDLDADLIPRLAAGDDKALGELMDRHMSRIHGLATRLLGDPVMAEDVTQTVFLKTWQIAPDWVPGKAKLITWMSRIGTHACFDIIKKKKPVYVDSPPELIDDHDDAAKGLMIAQRRQTVDSALAALPDNQRAAMVLCYYQYMSQTEAAEILGVSVKAYESLLSRARRQLSRTLDPELLNLGAAE